MKIPKRPKYKKAPRSAAIISISILKLRKKILEGENYTEENGRDFGLINS
jgi:hypothetical protein